MKLTKIAVDNPVFATMMMVALLVMGLFSYRQLGIDQFPNVDFPVVVVTTDYPGASPETVETEVSRKIEESVNAIAGLKTLTSRSLEGKSIVIAEFELSVASAVATQDVREKVQQVRAAHHVRNALGMVVNHHSELIREKTIGACDDKIADVALNILRDHTLYGVDKGHLGALRAHSRSTCCATSGQAIAASAGIHRPINAMRGGICDLATRAGAAVRAALRL